MHLYKTIQICKNMQNKNKKSSNRNEFLFHLTIFGFNKKKRIWTILQIPTLIIIIIKKFCSIYILNSHFDIVHLQKNSFMCLYFQK